jgi:hypothetical protein
VLDPNGEDARKIAAMVEQRKCPDCSALRSEIARIRKIAVDRLEEQRKRAELAEGDYAALLTRVLWQLRAALAKTDPATCAHTHIHRGYCPECARNELPPTGPVLAELKRLSAEARSIHNCFNEATAEREFRILLAENADSLIRAAEERAAKDAEIERLAEELTRANRNNHERNVALDALHYVWCSGGCEGGVHRFGDRPPLTEEIVHSALYNTRRLVRYFENLEHRKLSDSGVKANWEERVRMAAERDELQRQLAAVEQSNRVAEDLLNQREADLALEARRLDHILDSFDGDEEINGATAMDYWDADAMDADETKELRRAWREGIDAAMRGEEPAVKENPNA